MECTAVHLFDECQGGTANTQPFLGLELACPVYTTHTLTCPRWVPCLLRKCHRVLQQHCIHHGRMEYKKLHPHRLHRAGVQSQTECRMGTLRLERTGPRDCTPLHTRRQIQRGLRWCRDSKFRCGSYGTQQHKWHSSSRWQQTQCKQCTSRLPPTRLA